MSIGPANEGVALHASILRTVALQLLAGVSGGVFAFCSLLGVTGVCDGCSILPDKLCVLCSPPKPAPRAMLPQVVGVYCDLDLGVSLSHEDAFRMVVCLRKQQEPADTPEQQ